MVTKENQIKFYSEELRELELSVKHMLNATGWSLFQDGSMYIGQYRGIDEKRGNVFVDIPYGKDYHSPRLDQQLNCFTLKAGMEKPSAWLNTTYAELLKDRNRTEAFIIDYIPSKREGWITMLVRGMDTDFVKHLQYNQILGFGPTIPPFEYLMNLISFSKEFDNKTPSIWNSILSFQLAQAPLRQPQLLTEEVDIPAAIIEAVEKAGIYLLQGPPGTGKTYLIADLVSRLVLRGHSVLVTALTNKAVIELCEKPFSAELFLESRVSKLPLLTEEHIKHAKLLPVKDLVPKKGHLTLTTYYQFSRIWESHTKTYDYVIVEEASQAFLTTIAAAAKVGKKVIVVGDPKQIVPIVMNKNFKKIPDVEKLIHGMNTLSEIAEFDFKRKVETRRLTERSTVYTNSFYDNTICTKSLHQDIKDDISLLPGLSRYMHVKGGPSLILFPNDAEHILERMQTFLIDAINAFWVLKHAKIAVLTPHIEALTYLQQHLKTHTHSRNYLIETVDRVQGLDVDYCFYVVPRASAFAFNLNRFNVATSRARKCTFILAAQDFDKILNLPAEVGRYISRLKDELSVNI